MKKQVFESLDNAVENGYDLKDWSAQDLAEDLSDYDSYFNDKNVDEIKTHVKQWQEERGMKL